ncbi:hypothetical protein BQ8794_290116 [Mesorhizobium prunaredense]|uniref:Uncharacterized protein n=1 Tax=Mesorhizobium prunaredense TaxID=1631249 RepID=A0A1R3V9D7_9HYPH|nr:hypothetical protein BQ8794_290116 [Mesorhizobium prunaredense]
MPIDQLRRGIDGGDRWRERTGGRRYKDTFLDRTAITALGRTRLATLAHLCPQRAGKRPGIGQA